MSRQSRMRKILEDSFAPISLEIFDDSASHAGHAGHRAEGETHYNLEITSAAFADMSRVARQRAIMTALREEFETGLHALSIKANAP